MLKVERLTPALGASVTGIDLGRPLAAPVLEDLSQLLAEHQVLFFRDQDISPAAHRELGLAFGSLMRHPTYPCVDGFPDVMVLDNDRDNPSKLDEWHIDMSFTDRPPLGSILIGRIVPVGAGDTMFASLAAAYDDLPPEMQARLEGLSATHSLAWGFKDTLAEPGGPEKMAGAIAANPPVVHPLVRVHPETGRKLLYFSRTFIERINELEEGESAELIEWLHRHTTQDKYTYRFAWQPGSVAFWDNRSIIHVPVNDYWPARRRMERVTIEGPRLIEGSN